MAFAEMDSPWATVLEISVEAWYAHDPDRGRAACEYLLSRPDLPPHIRAQTERNLTYYTRPIADLAPGIRFTQVPRLAERGWSWFNPSIAIEGDDIHLLVRSSNYSIQPDRRYAIYDRDRNIRTRCYHLVLDANLELRNLSPVTSSLDISTTNFPVKGFEDCRLVRLDDQWLSFAPARDHNSRGVCQQFLLRMEDNAWVVCHPLSAPEDGHQKNWMPIVTREDLLVVQRCYPLTVLRIDPTSGQKAVVARHESTPLATSFRGGSQGVSVEAGWLFVIHEMIEHTPHHRTYLHRLILLDHTFHLTHVSSQFFFSRKGIEYCAGLARQGDDLLVSIGVDDHDAWIVRLPLHEALAMLQQVDVFANMPETLPSPPALQGATPDRAGIISVTLAGQGTECLIADALRSVIQQVDHCLVIDTGIGSAGLEEARRTAGDRLLVRTLDWAGDFAAARNSALRFASETGAAWAITVDTDERVQLDGTDLQASLAGVTSDVFTVPHADALYSKPRVFRLPTPGRWVGQTHEYFDLRSATQQILADTSFTEVAKSAANLQVKLERDETILRTLTRQRPYETRWWYYLGDTLRNLGDNPGAISAFDHCASLNGWAEEAAWARYREAECWLVLGSPGAAVQACAAGLACHPGIAELSWMAGYASWKAKRYEDAVHWSELAIVHGALSDSGAHASRIGFRNPMALYEGPYDVLRHALRAMGRDDAADVAERQFQTARNQRIGQCSLVKRTFPSRLRLPGWFSSRNDS